MGAGRGVCGGGGRVVGGGGWGGEGGVGSRYGRSRGVEVWEVVSSIPDRDTMY